LRDLTTETEVVMARDKDDLWRNSPEKVIEFDQRFATEEAYRAYWIEARSGGEPACARCGSKRVWSERGDLLFECGGAGPTAPGASPPAPSSNSSSAHRSR
jgi:hypothetical protein